MNKELPADRSVSRKSGLTNRVRGKTAIHLARKIALEIYESGMQPGDRYHSEAEALERHGVSRGALREALRFLQIQGVIVIKPGPGGGAFVDKPDWEELASTLALVLQFSGATVESLMMARAVLDPGIVELAARHRTDADCRILSEALDRMATNVGNYPDYFQAYNDFWDSVGRATHNPLLAMLSPSLRLLTRSAGITATEPAQLRAVRYSREVLDAIRTGDSERGRLAMKQLKQHYVHEMQQHYPRQIRRIVSFSDLADPDQ